MELLPLWYQYAIVCTFGLLIGSFLNVVMYRFHTGKSLSGNSHCLSCGTRLRWFELIPLLSYVCLWGRCRSCGCSIPARYFLLEFATAGMFTLIYAQLGLTVLSAAVLLLGVVLAMITVYDLYHMVIPNELVLATGVVAVAVFFLQTQKDFSGEVLLYHALAGFGAFCFYGGLWLVSKGRWIGFGDAKLALPLGFILGPMGSFSFVVLSFWIGAAISIMILILPRLMGYLRFVVVAIKNMSATSGAHSHLTTKTSFTIKSEVPFAPFMVAAFALVFLYGIQVLEVMMHIV